MFLAMEPGESIIAGTIARGGERLDKALAEASGLSRERVKALLGEGRIELAGLVTRQASFKPAQGAAFRIAVPAAIPAEAEAQDIPLVIVHEDEYLVVIDKPAGLVVHPAAGNLDGTLVNALLHHCRGQLSGIGGVSRPGIVHRIDKDTSGLLVVAKSDAAHLGLASQFADHSIERAYLALVAGHPAPPAGTVAGSIGRSPVNRKKMAMVGARDEGAGASTRSPISRPWSNSPAPRWSNAGWRPDAPTRCAFTWRQSVMRYWAILHMDAHQRLSGQFSRGFSSAGRRFTPLLWASSIRFPAKSCVLPATCRSISNTSWSNCGTQAEIWCYSNNPEWRSPGDASKGSLNGLPTMKGRSSRNEHE